MRMTKVLTIIAFALVVPTTGAVAQDMADVARVGAAFRAHSEAPDLLRDITLTVGHRMSATPNGAAAEAFVFDRLKSFGFAAVHYESFPMTGWVRGPLTLEIDGKRIAAAALGYSPARIDIKRPLADVGNGVPADYATMPGKVRGKIALIYLGKLPGSAPETPSLGRIDKLLLAVRHGAVGVIFINADPGDVLATGAATRSMTPSDFLTGVVVGRETGMALKKRVAAGTVIARVRMNNKVAAASARNIVATIPGTDLANETIVLGAHLDSWDLSAGAFDNGVGSMAVLDVARGFKALQLRPRRTIQFVFFMGEEQGLYGSLAYVDARRKDGSIASIKYMVNTDMAFDPSGYNAWGGAPDMEFYDALARTVQAVFPSFTVGATTGNAKGVTSTDSQPFIEAGVPIAYPSTVWPTAMLNCVHSDCDTLENVAPDGLRRSAGTIAMLAMALASADRLPAKTMSQAEVDAYFQAEGLKRWR